MQWGLSKIFEKELLLIRSLEESKISLTTMWDYQPDDAYRSITGELKRPIDHNYLTQFLRVNDLLFTEDDILYILRRCDIDRDGIITFNEFFNAITPFSILVSEKRKFLNSNGKIDEQKLNSMISNINVKDQTPSKLERIQSSVSPVKQFHTDSSQQKITQKSTPQKEEDYSYKSQSPQKHYMPSSQIVTTTVPSTAGESPNKFVRYFAQENQKKKSIIQSEEKLKRIQKPSLYLSGGSGMSDIQNWNFIKGYSNGRVSTANLQGRVGSPNKLTESPSKPYMYSSNIHSHGICSTQDNNPHSRAIKNQISPKTNASLISSSQKSQKYYQTEEDHQVEESKENPSDIYKHAIDNIERYQSNLHNRERQEAKNSAEPKQEHQIFKNINNQDDINDQQPSEEDQLIHYIKNVQIESDAFTQSYSNEIENQYNYSKGIVHNSPSQQPVTKGDLDALLQYLQAIIVNQRAIELIKNDLAIRSDFSLLKIFRFFDPENQSAISEKQIVESLSKIKLQISIEDALIIIRKYDRLKNGYLKYSDFSNLFQPISEELAVVLENQTFMDSDKFTQHTNKFIKQLFTHIVQSQKEIEQTKISLQKRKGYNIESLFNALDTDLNGYISYTEMNNALHQHNINVSKEELHSLIKRFDLKRLGQISFQEFSKEINQNNNDE